MKKEKITVPDENSFLEPEIFDETEDEESFGNSRLNGWELEWSRAMIDLAEMGYDIFDDKI